MIAGDKTAIRQLDIGGLMVTIKHLMTDTAYIQKIKEEFVFGSFDKLIQGDDLMLEEPVWDYLEVLPVLIRNISFGIQLETLRMEGIL